MTDSEFTRTTPPQRRVVVTGLGTVNPLGLSTKASWEAALNGTSGIDKITQFDASGLNTQFAGEVKGFDPEPYVSKKDQKKMDRFIHLSMAAAQMAIDDCGIEWTDEIKENTGVLVGVGIGGLPMIEAQHTTYMEKGARRISPFFIPAVLTNLVSGQLTIKHGFKGVNYSVTSACATGNHSIGEAANYIRNGQADVMLAGGSESAVCALAISGFGAMKALSTRNDSPQTASRPWDKERDGFVLSEAAAVLVLESLESAKKRGATIYGEVSGYGVSSDAYHMTGPAPKGEGATLAMKRCLADARLNPEDIGYVNAHGTSTPMGDEIESNAIKTTLGSAAGKVWISSTKSMTGHALGAAGALESIFSLLALKEGRVPPTINLENPSDDCDLDYVPKTAREKQLDHVINNSFGFGGTNACLIFSKVH